MNVLSKHHALSLFVASALLMPAVAETKSAVVEEKPFHESIVFVETGWRGPVNVADPKDDPTGGKAAAKFCVYLSFGEYISFPNVANFDEQLGELILQSPYAKQMSAQHKTILARDLNAVIRFNRCRDIAIMAIEQKDVELTTRAFLYVCEREIQRRRSNPDVFVAELIARRDQFKKQIAALDQEIESTQKKREEALAEEVAFVVELFGCNQSSGDAVACKVNDDDVIDIAKQMQKKIADLDVELQGLQAEFKELAGYRHELKSKAGDGNIAEREEWASKALFERQLRYAGLQAKMMVSSKKAYFAGKILECRRTDANTSSLIDKLQKRRVELAGMAAYMTSAAESKNAEWRTEKLELAVPSDNKANVIRIRTE